MGTPINARPDRTDGSPSPTLVWVLATATALILASGCGRPAAAPIRDPLDGDYRTNTGRSTIVHYEALTSRFAQLHPGVHWIVEDLGSTPAIALVAEGELDLAFVARPLTAAEAGRVEAIRIGSGGTGVAVSTNNPVANLSTDELRQIFSGETTDWAAVGGAPGKMHVLVLAPTSATRGIFDDVVFKRQPSYGRDAIEVYETDEMVEAVSSLSTGIGMISLRNEVLTNPRIKLVAIDGIAPTKANLASGSFPMDRGMSVVYSLDPSRTKPAVQAFLDFIRGPEGQEILGRL